MSGRRRWVERMKFVVSATTPAAPEAMFGLIANLASHLEWSGTRLPANTERLLAMEAPAGEATAGTEFASTGYTSIGTFHDRSRVTVVERPRRFEFVTESRLVRPDGNVMASTFEHRFIVEATPAGTRVTRTARQARFYEPAPWWVRIFAWPPVAGTLYRWMGLAGARASLRQLVAMAEEGDALRSIATRDVPARGKRS